MNEYKNLIKIETVTGSYLKYKPESLEEFINMAISCNLDSKHLKLNAIKYGFEKNLKEIKEIIEERLEDSL